MNNSIAPYIMWFVVAGFIIFGIMGAFTVHPTFLLLIAYSLILLSRGFITLPADPSTVGIVTFWGKKTNMVLNEGIYLLAPDFPFLLDIIAIDMTKKNLELTITDVPCQDETPDAMGVKKGVVNVSVRVGITYSPDNSYDKKTGKNRLANYILSGREKGIERIISEKVGDEVRQMGKLYIWRDFIRATDFLAYRIIQQLTDEPISNAKLDAVSESSSEEEKRNAETIINEILKQLALNGIADVQDLGILIKRVNISKIEGDKDIENAAKLTAKEEQERRAEVYELDTELQQAESMLQRYKVADPSTPKTLEDCLLEVRQRKAIRNGQGNVYEVPGLATALDRIATVAENLLGGKSNG